jgi:large subunit ribosomal protein L17
MRHGKRTEKFGRTSAHRSALLASLVCALIAAGRIRTTLPKAKAARRLAEKMVTLAKRGTLATRRRAVSILRRKDRVAKLFSKVGPAFADRHGGYTRILRLDERASDSSEMAFLEWVDYIPPEPKAKKEKKGAAGKPTDTAGGRKSTKSATAAK